MSKVLTVLFTDVSHPVVAGGFETLRSTGCPYKIIGVDHTPIVHPVGKLWVDHHYLVPPAKDPQFVTCLLGISQKHKVDLIVPWTNEDTVVIAKNAKRFLRFGIKILASDINSVEKVVDKAVLMENLKSNGFPVPKFFVVNNPSELEEAVKKLGYPSKKVVLKPRNLSGTRGFCVLDSHPPDLSQRDFSSKLPLSALLEIVRHLDKFRQTKLDYVAMDFLSGADYSIDALANQGEPIVIIPRLRLQASGGVSQIGQTVFNSEVTNMTAKVIRTFKLHLNVNVQMKYSEQNGGVPMVYDVNPRVSGTIAANAGAGINLLHYGIQMAIGNSILPSDLTYKHILMVRRWKEVYLNLGGRFSVKPALEKI